MKAARAWLIAGIERAAWLFTQRFRVNRTLNSWRYDKTLFERWGI